MAKFSIQKKDVFKRVFLLQLSLDITFIYMLSVVCTNSFTLGNLSRRPCTAFLLRMLFLMNSSCSSRQPSNNFSMAASVRSLLEMDKCFSTLNCFVISSNDSSVNFSGFCSDSTEIVFADLPSASDFMAASVIDVLSKYSSRTLCKLAK